MVLCVALGKMGEEIIRTTKESSPVTKVWICEKCTKPCILVTEICEKPALCPFKGNPEWRRSKIKVELRMKVE